MICPFRRWLALASTTGFEAAGADCPVVSWICAPRPAKTTGCFTATRINAPNAIDERKAYRIDAEGTWRHTVKAGLDYENYSVVDGTSTLAMANTFCAAATWTTTGQRVCCPGRQCHRTD